MFPFLTAFIIFGLVLAHSRHRTTRLQARKSEEFWKREAKANSIRKVSLDCLDYITIPLNLLEIPNADEELSAMLEELKALSTEKILNLTGKTNTDLKLEYGTANLTFLTNCDQRFTHLARLLNKIGQYLYDHNDMENSLKYLEFAIECNTDISSTYILLKKLYIARNEYAKIDNLLKTAESLDSLMKKTIIRHLSEN